MLTNIHLLPECTIQENTREDIFCSHSPSCSLRTHAPPRFQNVEVLSAVSSSSVMSLILSPPDVLQAVCFIECCIAAPQASKQGGCAQHMTWNGMAARGQAVTRFWFCNNNLPSMPLSHAPLTSPHPGVWGNLCGTAPSSAIFMAFYEPVKHAVQVGQALSHICWNPTSV